MCKKSCKGKPRISPVFLVKYVAWIICLKKLTKYVDKRKECMVNLSRIKDNLVQKNLDIQYLAK